MTEIIGLGLTGPNILMDFGEAKLDAAQATIATLADENAVLLRTNSNLRAALLAAALAVETRTDVPPSTVQAWRETAS